MAEERLWVQLLTCAERKPTIWISPTPNPDDLITDERGGGGMGIDSIKETSTDGEKAW
jgi:hypothetical protein